MSCSRTQHGDACGDQTQDLSIRSPTLYHYANALPVSAAVSCVLEQDTMDSNSTGIYLGSGGFVS